MSTVLFACHGATYTVRFRYDPTLVELLKAAVPGYARTWNPAAKEWTVDAGHAPQLASALRATGHQVVGLDPPPPRDVPGADNTQWARILFRRVGPNRRDPVFRALTKVLHPDVGGDHSLMQELNQAREQLTDGDR
jgi:hypothetical protein